MWERVIGTAILWLLLAAPLSGQELPWKEYVSYPGAFRVLTPGPFIVKLDSVETPIGKLGYHTFFFQPPEEERPQNLFYMVSYCDYPPTAVHSDSAGLVGEFFASTMDFAAESVQGELAYSDEIRMEGFPGRLWRINYLAGQAVIKTRAYLVENRYYSIQTITVAELAQNPSSQKFFDSFRFFPPEEKKP